MARKTKQAQVMTQPEELMMAEEVVEVAAPIVEAVKPIKARGIGRFITEQIMSTTNTNQQILDDVLANFEGAKTTMACIAWYKTKLRKEGKIAAKVKLATPVETTEEALV